MISHALPWPTEKAEGGDAAKTATLKDFTAAVDQIDWGSLVQSLMTGHGTPEVAPLCLDESWQTLVVPVGQSMKQSWPISTGQ